MTLLALGLLVVLAAFRLGSSGAAGRAARPLPAFLAYLLPALFLAFVLYQHRDEVTRFRFALLGYGFRGEPGRDMAVDIGGNRDQAGVWVRALRDDRHGSPPVGRLLFRAGRGEHGTSRVLLEPARDAVPGFFGLRRGGGRLTPVQTVRLESGDRVTVAGRTWTVDLHAGLFGFSSPASFRNDAGLVVPVPARESDVPMTKFQVPVGRPLPASQETYSLAYLEKKAAGAVPSPIPRAFLFRLPGLIFDGGVFLAAPAGSATVERNGQPLEIQAQIPLQTGDGLHVLSFPIWDGQDFDAGGLRDRRSFHVGVAHRGFTLELDTKEVHALPWRRATPADRRIGLEDLAISTPGAKKDEPLRVSLAMGSWQFVDKSLHFTHASQRVAGEALAVFELPRDPAKAEEGYSAATPLGQGRSPFGRPVWLGGETMAAVQLDVLRAPLGLALLALALVLFKAAAAQAARLTNTQLAFAAALEALVVLRVLLGFRAWAMPPFSDEAFRLAMVTWMLVPWGFLAASLSPVRFRDGDGAGPALLENLPVYAGLFVSAVWCFQLSGGGARGWVWVFCHGLLFVVPWLRALFTWAISAARAIFRRTARLARVLTDRIARKSPRRLNDLVRAARASEIFWWTAWAFAPALIRVVLFFFGAKESLPLPNQRFALTLLHVPLAVVLEAAYLAWLWRQVERRGGIAVRALYPALAFVGGTWVFPAFLVSDLGLALLNVSVFLTALALLAVAALRRAHEEGESLGLAGRSPALILGAFVLCLLFTASPAGARLVNGIVTFFKGEEMVERNYLRILAFAYPDELGRIARRSSEELAVMNRVMGSYTSRPFAQCRYFTSELSPHLQATTLREHVTAVLLAAEWTVVGVIGAILLYSAAGAAGLSFAPWKTEESDGDTGNVWRSASFFRATAFLSALTFALPSIYMILANYRLTLFTGKNVYLLGLDSNADVLEALALAALFAAAAATVREMEEEL